MTKRRRRSKKWVYWFLVLILIITAGVVGYFVWDGYFREKEKPVSENSSSISQKEEVKPTEPENKEEPEKEKTEEPVEEAPEKIEQYDGGNPNLNSGITGVITYAGVAGENLIIRLNIDQYLASGKCELSLMRDGAMIYSDSAGIIDSAATSTCEGFNVPVAKLGTGKLGIRILVTSGEKTGIIEGEVDL